MQNANNQLLIANTALVTTERAKEFISMISHELKTPLVPQVAYGKMSREYVYELDMEKTVHRILYMAMTHVRSEQSNSLLENILYINDFTNYCQQ